MKQLNESLFRTICLAFSALILTVFLLTTIDAAVERDRRGRLARELTELEEENERLRAQVQKRYSPEELEAYARERLGMQPAGPGQIIYLPSPD